LATLPFIADGTQGRREDNDRKGAHNNGRNMPGNSKENKREGELTIKKNRAWIEK